jgi:hypothetical protein
VHMLAHTGRDFKQMCSVIDPRRVPFSSFLLLNIRAGHCGNWRMHVSAAPQSFEARRLGATAGHCCGFHPPLRSAGETGQHQDRGANEARWSRNVGTCIKND